jgi:hypothetical protein
MSKISYCSLEEAWGESYNKKNNDSSNLENINNINNNINNTVSNISDSNNTISNRNKYDTLNKESQIERENVITNMNSIERNKKPENNSIVSYDKYRFNSENKVNSKSYENNYTPFQESLEKKYLQDKLLFLENEFKRYKYLIEKSENNRKISNRDSYMYSSEDSIENFSNSENSTKDDTKNNYISNNNGNDIIDLFLLIIIGLVVIFVMNSIFNIGKRIGASSKS